MEPLTTSTFALPDTLSAKADPALIGADEQHFAAIAASLASSIAELSGRLDAERRAPGGDGEAALDRDLEIHRLTSRLRTLRRFGLDLCLGRIVAADGAEPVYVGRLGLTDSTGRRLLVDWRSPAAEPFFAATHAHADGADQPPPVPLDPRPDHRLLGRGVRPRRARGARRARRPVRVHRHPGQHPVAADARRAGHHPGRPGRDHPRGLPRRPRRRRRPGHRARPSSPCTGRPTCSTPTRGSATTAAGCCSSGRTSRTWPTSPTCCPASARTGVRTATLRDLVPEGATAAAERGPRGGAAEVDGATGRGRRGGGALLRGAAGRPPASSRRPGRTCG